MINKRQAAQKPLVSVIIPVFNRAGVIAVTLNSVKAQTYRPIEVFVVDDGSVDETALEVQSWIDTNTTQNLRVHLVQQENQGAPAARNRGIEEATGRYFQFLDSDDTLEPKKIDAQVEALESTSAEVAVCDFKYDYSDPVKDRIVTNDGPLLKKLVYGWSIYTSTPLIDAKLVKNQLRWNERLKRQQDIDFIFKVMMFAPRYIYTTGIWCNYVQHDGVQISDEYKVKAPQYFRRILSLQHFIFSLWKEIPKGRKVMVVKGILNLAKQGLGYRLKVILRGILSDTILSRIKKYA